MNKAIISGHLGADPEIRYTQSNTAVMNLRIASKETWIDSDRQRQEHTEWHSIVVWGKRAEGLHKHLAKGQKLIVVGRIRTSQYEDREGVKRYKTEIVADEVEFAGDAPGGRRDEPTGGEGRPSRQRPGWPGRSQQGAPPRGDQAAPERPAGGQGEAGPRPTPDGELPPGPVDDFGYGPGGGDDDIPF